MIQIFEVVSVPTTTLKQKANLMAVAGVEEESPEVAKGSAERSAITCDASAQLFTSWLPLIAAAMPCQARLSQSYCMFCAGTEVVHSGAIACITAPPVTGC